MCPLAQRLHRLLRLPTDFFRTRNVGDLQLRFGALDELRAEIQQLLEGGLLRLVLTSIYILFMLRISVKLTALALVVAALILLPTALIGLQSRPLQRQQEEAEGQAQSRNLELLGAVAKLRLAGAAARVGAGLADEAALAGEGHARADALRQRLPPLERLTR